MSNNYWKNFWSKHAVEVKNENPQKQILRTINGEPIEKDLFEKILKNIEKNMKLLDTDEVLDLGCGNGIITEYLASKSERVVGVDFSSNLLQEVNTNKFSNISLINEDMRTISFEKNSFDKILIYAGLQYLTKKESIELFLSIRDWLKKGGLCYVGAIPDKTRIWSFYNTKKRKNIYFDRLLNENPLIGTWYDPQWLVALSEYSNFEDSKIIDQPDSFPNSHYRFDAKFKKEGVFRCSIE